MAKACAVSGGLLRAALFAAIFGAGSAAFADPADFDAAIEVLKETARSPNSDAPSAGATNSGRPQFSYPATVIPTVTLLTRLQTFFASYFDKPVNLIVLLQRLVIESAVLELPDLGLVLYNPTHMLFLYLPQGLEDGADIRVATLEDLQEILALEKSANPILAAYAQGFEQFAILGKVMNDPSAKGTLEVIWSMVPRSEDDKKRVRYLLLRPVEQTMALAAEAAACREALNRFVDDVRAGKRADVPRILGVTDTLRPVRFIRRENEIYVVLGEQLMARYYVLAHFSAEAGTCRLEWNKPSFVM